MYHMTIQILCHDMSYVCHLCRAALIHDYSQNHSIGSTANYVDQNWI